MSNIEELQRRIATAMDRVAQGVEQMGNAAPAPDPGTAQALEDERTANAQLSERIRTLKTKSETEAAALHSQVEESRSRIALLDIELQRVRRANQELTNACAALRAANFEGVGAELEALRAARAADVAESSAILAALTPLVNGAADGTNNEENADA
jgi:predicted RNase H-like nuclease (RuvC/YqgF family)